MDFGASAARQVRIGIYVERNTPARDELRNAVILQNVSLIVGNHKSGGTDYLEDRRRRRRIHHVQPCGLAGRNSHCSGSSLLVLKSG
jgi:hypothetical protein